MASETDYAGGCLCGAVRYLYSGPFGGALGAVTACHCSQCRRAQGFASAVAPILTSAFVLQRGGDQIRHFASSPDKVRAFCSQCGSPIYSRRDSQPDVLRLRLGSLDNPPQNLILEAHIFTADAPQWAKPNNAPRYPGVEPGRS